MNTIVLPSDVKLFVAAVREHLADLSDDEREELVGGLEADMFDLVAERGVDALPEPSAYARELRAAAGFAPEGEARRRGRRDVRGGLTRLLDGAHERWERSAVGLPGQPWEVLVALRPVWWVLRAWVALQLVDLLWGGGAVNYGLSPVPSLASWVVYDAALLAVAVLVSVLMGLGKVWPGRGALGARVLLLALNLLAIGALPATLGGVYTPARAEALYGDAAQAEAVASTTDGLAFDGEQVANVYPYDASGKPLTGVQLVDDQGRRLSLSRDPAGGELYTVPWLNGRTELFSVFPLAERTGDPETGAPVGAARLLSPPYASLPPVSLTGVTPSVLQPAEPAATPRKRQGNR